MDTRNEEFMDREPKEQPVSRIMSFRKQRILFTLVIFLIGFAFTTAILWGHVEGVIGKAGYQTLAKAGLILLPALALIMTIWELFIDKVGPGRVHKLHPTVTRLIDWCFFGSLILLVAELLHAGALLKYESSTAEQNNKIAAVGAAQAQIAGAATSAAIESAGKTAQELNASGQRKTAAKIVNTGKEAAAAASAKAGEEVSKIAKDVKPETFLPEWYIGGGMYAALPLLAALFFGITMALARQAAPHVDADDDGRPDHLQGSQPVGHLLGQPVYRSQLRDADLQNQNVLGFHSNDPRLLHFNGMADDLIWTRFQSGGGAPETRRALAEHYGLPQESQQDDSKWVDSPGKVTRH